MKLEDDFSKTNDVPLIGDASATSASQQRQKPGPKKSAITRTEKESCRLTKEENARFKLVCKKRRIKPADYLRECCLAAIYTSAPIEKTRMVADVFMRLHEMQSIADQMKEELGGSDDDSKKSAEIIALNNKISSIRKMLKATLYAGVLVVAASAAHVEAEHGDMMDVLMRLRNDMPVTLICALTFGICLGILAEKLSAAGHLSLASAKNWVRRIR